MITSTDAKNDYLEQLFRIEISEVRELFELDLKKINKGTFSDWERICSKYNGEFEVVLKERIPPRLLDAFCEVTNELHQDVIYKSRLFDDSFLSLKQIIKQQDVYEKRGIVQLFLLLFEKESNQLVGYTDVTLDP